jgi:hypothetical protein
VICDRISTNIEASGAVGSGSPKNALYHLAADGWVNVSFFDKSLKGQEPAVWSAKQERNELAKSMQASSCARVEP